MHATHKATENLYYFNPPFSELKLNLNNIRSAMGYPDSGAPPWFEKVFKQLLREARKNTDLQAGFCIVQPPNATWQKEGILVDSVFFRTEKIITGQLKKIEGAALFLVSIGEIFDQWSREFFKAGDPFKGYTADLIGSEIAESLADWLECQLHKHAAKLGLNCSNRYSPGYCDWDVSEQKRLFGFFPDKFCNVQLTSSSLMLPIKSVSGLIGLGKSLTKKDYQCNLCNLEHCYKRNQRARKENHET